jgi:cytochrome P450
VNAKHMELPPSGPVPRVLQTIACRRWPIEYLEACRRRLGPQFTVHPIDMPPLVFVSDSASIRAILTAPLSTLHAGEGALITEPIFGASSFLLQDEAAYMALRNVIQPHFSRDALQAQRPVVLDAAERHIRAWPSATVFASHRRLSTITLEVILRIALSRWDEVVQELHRELLQMLAVTTSPVLQEPRLRLLPGWRRTWRSFLDARANVDRLVARLICERRAEPPHEDVLGALLGTESDDRPLSDREVRDNLISVVVAGHETTSSTIAWLIQLLAHNQPVQARLVHEVAVGDDDAYLTATIHEAIRRRPVFLFAAPRAVAETITLDSHTYLPPAHLLACTYLLHHDPELYPEPRSFSPERFLGPASSRSWLPWGGGRKICPGRHLAMMEIKEMLRFILSQYRLLPAAREIETPAWRSALVTPGRGGRVVLSRRPHSVPLFNSEHFCSTHAATALSRTPFSRSEASRCKNEAP